MTDGLVKEEQFKAVPPSVSLGKEIRTASKNSVANHYSHCLDSPLFGSPSLLFGRFPCLFGGRPDSRSGPGIEERAATPAGASELETVGDAVD